MTPIKRIQAIAAAIGLCVCVAVLSTTPVDAAPAAQKPAKPCNPKKPNCPDTTQPSVAIASPATGTTVNGLVTLTGTASDNVAVSRVEIYVDSGPVLLATGTSSWNYVLDTGSYSDGPHDISARAVDAAGNASLHTISLNFANAAGSGPKVLVVGEVRVDPPTIHALGVQVLIAGDENRNASITVRYRELGSHTWLIGLPLLRVFPETITVAVPQQFAGSIFDLAPGTTYEIELRATDPDGSVDVRHLAMATTRPVPRTDPATPRLVPVSNATALRTALPTRRLGTSSRWQPGRTTGHSPSMPAEPSSSPSSFAARARPAFCWRAAAATTATCWKYPAGRRTHPPRRSQLHAGRHRRRPRRSRAEWSAWRARMVDALQRGGRLTGELSPGPLRAPEPTSTLEGCDRARSASCWSRLLR